MSKSTGVVLDPARYFRGVTPPLLMEDRSKYRNNGVFQNHTTWAQLPSGLWYIVQDGVDDYISIVNHPSQVPASDLTIEIWVYMKETTADRWLLNCINTGVEGYRMGFSDVAKFCIQVPVGAWSHICEQLGVVLANTWYHVVGVVDSVRQMESIYINGALNNEVARASATITPSPTPLYIGAWSGANVSNANYLPPNIYSRALSAGQVLQRYEESRRWFGL